MKPVVAIIGRPNVGKSTLFNCLMGRREAIVDSKPGVTRDRHYGEVTQFKQPFILIDTGGFEEGKENLRAQIRQQAQLAMEEADVILFLLDGKEGLTPLDQLVADLLRKGEKKVLYVVNKIDNEQRKWSVSDFYQLGVEHFHTISAEHQQGIFDLVKSLEAEFQAKPIEETLDPLQEDPKEVMTRVAFVGCPNVGKSSLINAILGDERLIVDETPGTTRDTIYTLYHFDGMPFFLVDTAGIRRKSRIIDRIEKFSAIKALQCIERCHIACVVLDASRKLSDQDKRIASYVHEAGRGCLLIVNKWDLIKNPDARREWEDSVRDELRNLSYAPMVFTSAKTKKGIPKIFEAIQRIARCYNAEITTGELNRAFTKILHQSPPPLHQNRPVKLYYITQTKTRPPTFTVFVNQPKAIHYTYTRYLKNQLREAFGLEGTDLRLIYRTRQRSSSQGSMSK